MPRRATSQQVFLARPARRPRGRSTFTRNPGFNDQTIYSATITNNGTLESSPVISKTGVTGPTTVYLENATAGRTVWVNVPVGSGDLSVDFGARTVTFAGSTISGAIGSESRWWTLAPGANTVRSNVTASVSHRDAYTG